jgi:hypothetical protein
MVFRALDRVHEKRPITTLVHGACRAGADDFAQQWAMSRGVYYSAHRADWRAFGSAAGPRRNAHMLQAEAPDLVMAFPGGRGTADMVRRALAANVPVLHVRARELAAAD